MLDGVAIADGTSAGTLAPIGAEIRLNRCWPLAALPELAGAYVQPHPSIAIKAKRRLTLSAF